MRIDDLDVERSKREYVDAVMKDFEMLGLTWDRGPYFQQGREEAYRHAFDALSRDFEVYPCFCTRADLKAASAPHRGEKLVYAGTCRNLTDEERADKVQAKKPSWRIRVPNERFAVNDMVQGHYEQNLEHECGDFVIRRSDGLFAYQLATVVDDAAEGVNCIVRGMDLLSSTPQQLFLQKCLGFDQCSYAHVPLMVSSLDRRLSKRDHDASIDELMASLGSAEAVLGHIAFIAGLLERDEPCSCSDLLASFDIEKLPVMFPDNVQILWKR